ncbi:MAG: InlB B-repeat-containing protein [Propionibacteriaceae bacterium]|nr:InlB B-repeat-containing protein [Propionibacteriaceae bacterium]
MPLGTRIFPEYDSTLLDDTAFDRTYAMVNGAVNFVQHPFTYSISGQPNIITTVSGNVTLDPSGTKITGNYYEPVWQGWTACPDGSNVYATACPDGSAPRFYYRGNSMSGLFTLPRYDGMIYGFAGAETTANGTARVDPTVNTHNVTNGSNSQVQPLAINVDRPAGYNTAASALGPTTLADTMNGQTQIDTSLVDEPITVLITPPATTSGRYTTAFYTQDWMYWGSEARDTSNASPVKWTSGSGKLYDQLTAPNGTYEGGDLFRPSSSYEAMSFIPTWAVGTSVDSAGSAYTANQSGIPNSLEGVDVRLQGGGDPLTNPDNPAFAASQLVTATRGGGTGGGSTTIAALYGTASDNDGMIWLGGLGGSASSYGTNGYTSASNTLNAACANTYYVADDVKLRFAYPAGKEQEPVEHYYYPIGVDTDTGGPLYSNGRNDGSGVYDYNCGLALYGSAQSGQAYSLTKFSLDSTAGVNPFAPYFRGGSSFLSAWNQPFVRTTAAAQLGWTYSRAAAASDSSDRAKESQLHSGDRLPGTQVLFASNGEDPGTLPSFADTDTVATDGYITPDPSQAVLVDSKGRGPADPYDDPAYWYTVTRATNIDAAHPGNTTVTDYTGSYTQSTGNTGNLPVNNTGLATGADQVGSPAATFDQREYARSVGTSLSSNYARTSPLLRSVGQQLRQTCWTSQGSAAANGSLDSNHTCTESSANDPLGQGSEREWVLDTSAEGNHLQDGYHVANLGAAQTYDSDGDGVITAADTGTGQVYPAYTVPSDTIPTRDGYVFLGYQVKAYGTSYSPYDSAQCWAYDNFRNGIADYVDPMFATAQGLANSSGWNSTVTTVCDSGRLGYDYAGNGIATAVQASYYYQPVNTDVAANPEFGLTTVYVNGHPYVAGKLGDADVDGYVTTNGFEIVDTNDFVVVQPGDQIIAVGQNLDSAGNPSDPYPDDGYGYGDPYASTNPYAQDGTVGFEAPVWNLALEPVWAKAAYYTDRTNPDMYSGGALNEALPPDLLENCGAPLAACPAGGDAGWYFDDLLIEGGDYQLRQAEDSSGAQVGDPTFRGFTFDRYEAYLGDHVEGTKDAATGQLQPPSVDFHAGTNLDGDYAPGDLISANGPWSDLKITGMWRYRVRYTDRMNTSYDGVNQVAYDGSNPDRLTGSDADAAWDDRNYFYWDGSGYSPACTVPTDALPGGGNCAAPGDVTGSDQHGYNSTDYKIPGNAPTLADATFMYFKVWINGDLLTTGGTYAGAPGTGKYLPGDTIAWADILAHGGDIELRAVWETYQVVFHGVTNDGTGFVGKVTDQVTGQVEHYQPVKPDDDTTCPYTAGDPDTRAGDRCKDEPGSDGETYDHSWVSDGDGHDYVFTGDWSTGGGTVWDFDTGEVTRDNTRKLCFNQAGEYVAADALDADYCVFQLDLYADFAPDLYRVTFHPEGGVIANPAGLKCGTPQLDATCTATSEFGVEYIVPSYLDPVKCSDPQYTDQASCTAAGAEWIRVWECSDGVSGTEAECRAASPVWTDTSACSDGVSTDQATCEAVGPPVWTDTSSCSDSQYTDEQSCTDAGESWTDQGECSDPAFTDAAACTSAPAPVWTESGECSDPQYTDQATCEDPANETRWTPVMVCSDGTSADESSCLRGGGVWLPKELEWISTFLSLEDAFTDTNGWPADPTRTGYWFRGWYLEDTLTTANDETLYDSDNAHLGHDDQSYAGQVVCSDKDYTTQDDCEAAGAKWLEDKYLVMRDYDFYAKWVKKTFDLYYDLNTSDPSAAYDATSDWDSVGDNLKLDLTTVTADGYDEDREWDSKIADAPNYVKIPTRDHYDFVGWSLDSACSSSDPNPNDDRYAGPVGDFRLPDIDDGDDTNDPDHFTIYACWTIHVHDLYYHENAPDATMGSCVNADYSYQYGERIDAAAHYSPDNYSCIPTRPGYDFIGWTMDEEGLIPVGDNTMPDEDGHVYAQWQPREEDVDCEGDDCEPCTGPDCDADREDPPGMPYTGSDPLIPSLYALVFLLAGAVLVKKARVRTA